MFSINKNRKRASGFTLIELLVVVAIIGTLASVVLANLNESRKKGKDSAIKSQLKEFEKLLVLEYEETGSYANLQPDTWFPDTPCNSAFSGNHAVQAREMCGKLVALAGSWGIWASPYSFYLGNITSNADKYSMMVPLNSKDTFFCVGSSGSSDTETGDGGVFPATGCYDNP